MKLSLFDFHLPRELVAQQPLEKRDHSKLLVLNRASGEIIHNAFYEIPAYFSVGDVLVLNNTRVLPARLVGRRTTGGLLTLLLVKKLDDEMWEVLFQTKGRRMDGEKITIKSRDENTGDISAEIKFAGQGKWVLAFGDSRPSEEIIKNYGRAPLPPYIKRPKSGDTRLTEDLEKYQTVFAREEGSIAAPTAGLHFTPELLEKIRNQGVRICHITLHIGKGTFEQVKSEDVECHKMEPECFSADNKTLEIIREAKKKGNKVFATGTTSCRVLEWLSAGNLKVTEANSNGTPYGWTDLFIYPPYSFKTVDCLITNFHLPKGTPLMLACAFAGREKLMDAYRAAIQKSYRFFSYGDAMLIL